MSEGVGECERTLVTSQESVLPQTHHGPCSAAKREPALAPAAAAAPSVSIKGKDSERRRRGKDDDPDAAHASSTTTDDLLSKPACLLADGAWALALDSVRASVSTTQQLESRT